MKVTELFAEMASLTQGFLPTDAQMQPWRQQIAENLSDARLDAGLAELWRKSRPAVRCLALKPMLQDLELPKQLLTALLGSVQVRDPESANAALALLRNHSISLPDSLWPQLGRLAVDQRPLPVPDLQAAVFLAQAGPSAALPTVVNTVLRPGADDADDRLMCLQALGRFHDPRVPPLLAAIAQTQVATLEVLHAAATWVASGGDSKAIVAVLEAAVANDDADVWVRWSALDGLSRSDPDAALPWLIAALRAGGTDLPPWYLQACEQRIVALRPAQPPEKGVAGLPTLPPLPGTDRQIHARCPRIARAAMVRWQANKGLDTPQERQRAAVEWALVRQGLLLGSFLPEPPEYQPELPAQWRFLADVEAGNARSPWLNSEASWLAHH